MSEEFLAQNAVIRDALKDQRLLEMFAHYEAEAKSCKRSFQALGFGSLVFATISLLSVALSVLLGNSLASAYGLWGALLEFGSVTSIILLVLNRIGRYRVRWCQAVFCRERLRQWHFQKFLDGALMSLLPGQPAEFKAEMDRRWNILRQNLRDGYGMMTAFVHHRSGARDLLHHPSRYSDPHVATISWDAMCILRFEHQLGYGERKIEPQGELVGLALEEQARLSESVANLSLFGAVVAGALAFALSLRQAFPALGVSSPSNEDYSRILAGSALLLAVISAASRAYRAGYTLPDEIESYGEYRNRVSEIKAVCENVTSAEDRFRQLERLEEEAVAELRRFLKMKMRASFVY
ncbi:MAG: hypothetical protein LAQ69_17915 [Acidobacteriia bacterium]|nr:hypothetical protein [Terriglobia bacterium]